MRFNFPEVEKAVLKFWDDEKVFDQLRERNRGGDRWSFMDGPVTANNPLGVHHGWGRTYKDIFSRYHAMLGRELRWQNGFDCHGLWVEVEVEKELGFKSKRDINSFGLKEFAAACRRRVEKFSEIQTEQSRRLGQWMDWGKSYYTHSDENIAHIWKFLHKCDRMGLLELGERVMPWCTRCGSSLSQHELADSYREESDNAVYFKAPLCGRPRESLLVWTTTPWTLPANSAVAVHPDVEYVAVTSPPSLDSVGSEQTDTLWLSAQSPLLERITALGGSVRGTRPGREFQGLEYVKPLRQSFTDTLSHKNFIITWSDILPGEGTGIVHIAPGCGPDDHRLGKNYNLPVVAPLNEDGTFKSGFGELSGLHYEEVNRKVVALLSTKSLLYHYEKFSHRVPRCWRCKERLVHRLCEEWFIRMSPLRERLKEAAQKIEWTPAYSGTLAQEWLENMGDWCISRRRFWGLPLPFYRCGCGKYTVVSSPDELQVRAERKPHLHRPEIDELTIPCECGRKMSRVAEVGDCWLDAGVAPLSTLGFADKFDRRWFPYDFAVEMREQVRLWFYSSLVMSVVMTGDPPFKTVMTYEDMRDAGGEPFSKSKGNAPALDAVINEFGADPLRCALALAPTTQPFRFSTKDVEDAQKRLLVAWNCFAFFRGYVKLHDWKPKSSGLGKLNDIDRWILSRLQQLIVGCRGSLDSHNTSAALREIEAFVADLSHWYIRVKRPAFSGRGDKDAHFAVLRHVLATFAKLLAPFAPFSAEEMFRAVGETGSVHLEKYPEPDESLADEKILAEMTFLRRVVSHAMRLRDEAKIKARQPLGSLAFYAQNSGLGQAVMILGEILMAEANVKRIRRLDKPPAGGIRESDLAVDLDTSLNAELINEGMTREFIRCVQDLRKKADLTPKDKIVIYSQTPNGVMLHMREIRERTGYLDFMVMPPHEKCVVGVASLNGSPVKVGIAKVAGS